MTSLKERVSKVTWLSQRRRARGGALLQRRNRIDKMSAPDIPDEKTDEHA